MNTKSQTVSIPTTRDPFVNSQLVPAGIDPITGEERFWSSTWNGISGCTGVLITESGKNRLYRFNPDKDEYGFYGASYGGNDIMWLSCFLDSITRLDLITGETKTWKTGMEHALSVSGFVFDEKTEKVFWAAYCSGDFKNKGVSFDTKAESVSSIFNDIPLKNKQLRRSVKNTDGTYTFVNCIPDYELLWWDPVKEKVEIILENQKLNNNQDAQSYCVIIQNTNGVIYLPNFGWFDPLKRQFIDGVLPDRELAWFGADENFAYGCETLSLGNTAVYKWDLQTGAVEYLAEIPDALVYQFRLTKSNKIVCVNIYGFFYRIDAITGAIECSVKLDSDAVGHIDCIHRIDKDRMLCTPFITQRFYEINLKTGKSYDLGRATGGVGEVLKVIEMNNKIYMASYTKGQLVEYDPSLNAHFPENPRIVVNPPKNAMRPVALCKSDKTIFYSCSLEYGHLGSMLISYTPSENETLFTANPIEKHMIRSLEYNEKYKRLIAATTPHADCRSCVPKDDFCIVAIINPKTLLTEKTMEIKDESEYFHILGALTNDTYLCLSSDYHMELDKGYSFYILDISDFSLRKYPHSESLATQKFTRIYPYKKDGLYIIATKEKVELWNLNSGIFIKAICDNPGFYNAKVQDNRIYLVCKKEIHIVSII